MKKTLILLILAFSSVACKNQDKQTGTSGSFQYAIVIHGGAGWATPESLGETGIAGYEKVMDSVLSVGLDVLASGGEAADAVESVIRALEDDPRFNAGRGSVMNHDGIVEMDASIMQGSDLNAGAVAGVTNVRHPVSAARAVMEQSEHVMLSGKGAEEFAQVSGMEIIDQSYFQTEKSRQSLERALKNHTFGTVGCVALDRAGNLCAATSTGGRTNKRYGRIGDSPIIGAGTYAKNGVAGVSCTGEGEYYIRLALAHEVISLVEYRGMTIEQAAEDVINRQLDSLGGKGGVICLDGAGNFATVFNTTAMFRAYGNSAGQRMVEIFPE